ncbi:MAG: hypothetical protein IJ684_00900 [Bacteroidales bacterium]|nr:hypothetical protein [Bacteroidales bacterium]
MMSTVRLPRFAMRRRPCPTRPVLLLLLAVAIALSAEAQESLRFAGQSLATAPERFVAQLQRDGFRLDKRYDSFHSFRLLGPVAGRELFVEVSCDSTFSTICNVLVSTRNRNDRQPEADFALLQGWLQDSLGLPACRGEVGDTRFCLWPRDGGRDVLLVSARQSVVEVYFYENHRLRHLDYNAIVTHCAESSDGSLEGAAAPTSVFHPRRDAVRDTSQPDAPAVEREPATRRLFRWLARLKPSSRS